MDGEPPTIPPTAQALHYAGVMVITVNEGAASQTFYVSTALLSKWAARLYKTLKSQETTFVKMEDAKLDTFALFVGWLQQHYPPVSYLPSDPEQYMQAMPIIALGAFAEKYKIGSLCIAVGTRFYTLLGVRSFDHARTIDMERNDCWEDNCGQLRLFGMEAVRYIYNNTPKPKSLLRSLVAYAYALRHTYGDLDDLDWSQFPKQFLVDVLRACHKNRLRMAEVGKKRKRDDDTDDEEGDGDGSISR